MIGKSLHISWGELACKDKFKTPYPLEFIKDGRIIELIVMFERIRNYFGDYPIIINSAFRTLSYNKEIGGSPKSQHLLGKALDIQPPNGLSTIKFYIQLEKYHKFFGITGLGLYKTFCHVDIRDSSSLITWDLSEGKRND